MIRTATRIPSIDRLKQLVRRHQHFGDEPLLLAIYYRPIRAAGDIFLFEIIENFGDGAVDPERELFEVTYGTTSGFRLKPHQELHLILTNPREFEKAVREKWPKLEELRKAVNKEDYRVLYSHPQHQHLRDLIHA